MKNPIIGGGGILIEDGKILLVKRTAEPNKGLWTIPGGKLRWGERLEEAVKREIYEETGLKVEVIGIHGIYELIIKDDENEVIYHYVIIDYKVKKKFGELKASTDALEVKWFSKNELKNIETTETTKKLLEKLIENGEIY
ncbi:MAG: NUDIX hydrolase [Candidatus Methanomethylicia archaeon]